jgi:hypothetical protein
VPVLEAFKHPNIERFACPFCGAEYSKENDAKYHCQKKEGGLRESLCNF